MLTIDGRLEETEVLEEDLVQDVAVLVVRHAEEVDAERDVSVVVGKLREIAVFAFVQRAEKAMSVLQERRGSRSAFATLFGMFTSNSNCAVAFFSGKPSGPRFKWPPGFAIAQIERSGHEPHDATTHVRARIVGDALDRVVGRRWSRRLQGVVAHRDHLLRVVVAARRRKIPRDLQVGLVDARSRQFAENIRVKRAPAIDRKSALDVPSRSAANAGLAAIAIAARVDDMTNGDDVPGGVVETDGRSKKNVRSRVVEGARVELREMRRRAVPYPRSRESSVTSS